MISDRAKVEQSANRGHVHSNHYVQGHPPEAEVSTRDEPNHHSVHGAESDSESEQLDWDPERVDDDGYPLVDENRSTWVPVPRDGPRWTKPKQVRCQRGHKITGRSGKSARFRHRTGSLQTRVSLLRKKKVRKTLFTKKKNCQEEIETSAHHFERRRKNAAQNVSQEPNSEAYSLQPLSTTWTLGERVSESSTKGQLPGTREKVSSCQETPSHSCTILFPTWRARVCLNLWTGVQMDSKMRLIGMHPMTSGTARRHFRTETSQFCWFDLGPSSWLDGH